MSLRTLILALSGIGLYPLWLLGGALDYFSHRRTAIEHTSGARESWLHAAQFVVIAAFAALALYLPITLGVWSALFALSLIHSVLAYVDVSYTEGRRRIAPLEQFAHELMNLTPWFIAALLGIVSWAQQSTERAPLDLTAELSLPACTWIFGSLLVLAGAPIAEELWRTTRTSDARASAHRAALRGRA